MERNFTNDEILNRIAYLKNKKGLSAFQLSLQLGHASTYFYRLQTKTVKLGVEMLLEILEILDVSTQKFFYPDIENYEADMEILRAYKSLNEEEQKSIRTILKMKK